MAASQDTSSFNATGQVVETYVYHAPPVSSSSSSKKRKRVSKACVCCQRAHMSCDEGRPCKRCVERGMAHLCRDGQRKQRGRKRRGPRGSRQSDVEGEEDLTREEPEFKRTFFGSDEDVTLSPSESDDDIDIVGDRDSMDDDSLSVPPRQPMEHDWGMDSSSERSTLESSSDLSIEHHLFDADSLLSFCATFDPVTAREALQHTFFDYSSESFMPKLEAEKMFSAEASLRSGLMGYQLLDCSF